MAMPQGGYILGRDIHLEYCAGAMATADYTFDVWVGTLASLCGCRVSVLCFLN